MKKVETEFQQLLAGTQADLPASLTMHVDGEELRQAQVIARLQGFLAVYEQVTAAKAAYELALQAQEAIASQAHAFKVSYGQVLRHVLGKASPALASFGVSVQQRKPPSAETQLLANAKRLATRKARGTLGKRQKSRIKGAPIAAVTVTEQGSTPVTAAALDSESPPRSAPTPEPSVPTPGASGAPRQPLSSV